MQEFLTRFLLSPYLDQNVTLHVDFCPVCLLKTEHEENGGEYRCRETAGFIALGFSTRCKPSESWNIDDYFENAYKIIWIARIILLKMKICAPNFVSRLLCVCKMCDQIRYPCSETSRVIIWYEVLKFWGSCSFIVYLVYETYRLRLDWEPYH